MPDGFKIYNFSKVPGKCDEIHLINFPKSFYSYYIYITEKGNPITPISFVSIIHLQLSMYPG